MHALWTEPVANFDGAFYQLADAVLAPKPVQPGGIPIWFGGFSDQLLDLVVRFGCGWILGTNPDPDFIVERREVLWQKLDAAGRPRDSVRIAVPLMAHLSADGDRARATLDGYIERGNFGAWLGDFFGENARSFGLVGTAKDAKARLQPYLEIGARDFIFDLRPPGVALETAEILADSIVPYLNAAGLTMTDSQTERTRAVIEKLYDAYLTGDTEGMLALMAPDVEVTFNYAGTFHRYGRSAPLHDLEWRPAPRASTFNVRHKIVDGNRAAVTWDETGKTIRGDDWSAIGVDVYRVEGDQIVEMTCYSDTDKVARLLDPYPG